MEDKKEIIEIKFDETEDNALEKVLDMLPFEKENFFAEDSGWETFKKTGNSFIAKLPVNTSILNPEKELRMEHIRTAITYRMPENITEVTYKFAGFSNEVLVIKKAKDSVTVSDKRMFTNEETIFDFLFIINSENIQNARIETFAVTVERRNGKLTEVLYRDKYFRISVKDDQIKYFFVEPDTIYNYWMIFKGFITSGQREIFEKAFDLFLDDNTNSKENLEFMAILKFLMLNKLDERFFNENKPYMYRKLIEVSKFKIENMLSSVQTSKGKMDFEINGKIIYLDFSDIEKVIPDFLSGETISLLKEVNEKSGNSNNETSVTIYENMDSEEVLPVIELYGKNCLAFSYVEEKDVEKIKEISKGFRTVIYTVNGKTYYCN